MFWCQRNCQVQDNCDIRAFFALPCRQLFVFTGKRGVDDGNQPILSYVNTSISFSFFPFNSAAHPSEVGK